METVDLSRLNAVLAELRLERSDNRHFEVKTASGGMPESILETMSAFANTPGGGVIILGVDENAEFSIVGVYDPKRCQQALASYARKNFSITITIETILINVGSKQVVWARVLESDRTVKPVKIEKSGKAYIRLYDGDYHLSPQEEMFFIAGRGPSHFDEDTISGSRVEDLNKDLTQSYIARRRKQSQALAKLEDEDILFRTGVIDRKGELTVAGAVALGIFPQQFLPNYSIKVSVQKKSRPNRVRAVNVNSIDGPIPTILSETLHWLEHNTDELTLNLSSGHVRNVREYPVSVVRELVANTLIHRDMNPVSMLQNISLIIEDDRLVISNPGGLYGLSVDELGHTSSKTRNAKIAEICQYVVDDGGENVIERLGSGIPRILEELASLDMAPPTFIDAGIYFTVILKPAGAEPDEPVVILEKDTGDKKSNIDLILAALRTEPLSRSQIEKATGLTFAKVRYSLSKLIGQGRVQRVGNGTSAATKYTVL
ncbi:MAG: putative DNA binding domain-containing protein [Coriobacteriales bacterium]|jgi:ATP-dependent DNA helicase RecG|nr:putative DNA binding domain-containing protein [Coriobacteriales bacterium]